MWDFFQAAHGNLQGHQDLLANGGLIDALRRFVAFRHGEQAHLVKCRLVMVDHARMVRRPITKHEAPVPGRLQIEGE